MDLLQTIPVAIAITAQIACFAAISIASMRQFRADRNSLGMTIIRVLSLGSTVGLAWLVLQVTPGNWTAAATTVIAAILSWRLMTIALAAARNRVLDVAFTGNGPDQLVTTGIYRYLRNPLYTAYLIYWAGWVPVAGGHPAAVGVALMFAAIYWLAIKQEEAFLSRKFTGQYNDYCSRTGRFLPVFSAPDDA